MLSKMFKNGLFVLAFLVILGLNAQAATITGVVKYEGDVPTFSPIKMDADPICLSKHKDAIYPESLVLGDGNTLANAFVYVKNPPQKDYPVPAEAVILDQEGCHYIPHVLGVRVGQPLKFLNPDGTLHNVHALSKVNPEFNMAMPQFRKEASKTFDKAEMFFPLKCDVHPWMEAWCAVMPHPFFSVTGKDGKFSIAGLDAGTYDVEVWHEKLGTKSMSITVTADETKTADFALSRPGK